VEFLHYAEQLYAAASGKDHDHIQDESERRAH
jgi:hypothetical protein